MRAFVKALNQSERLAIVKAKMVIRIADIIHVVRAGFSLALMVGTKDRKSIKPPIENAQSCHCIFELYPLTSMIKKMTVVFKTKNEEFSNC